MTTGNRTTPVPTLCVGTYAPTLRVASFQPAGSNGSSPANSHDAERRPARSHAERGNERAWLLAAAVVLVISCPAHAFQADDDDDDFIPGLVARYTVGTKSVDHIDRDVQFDWSVHSPDSRLPTGSFSATWTGKLLIRTEGKHAFHLYLNGEATIKLDGKTVVSGEREMPGWIAGELIDVENSEPKIEIAYRRTGEQALIRLFWSSEKFSTEPIPPQLFFRDAPRHELDLVARGGELFRAYRCLACHRGEHDDSAEPAPALAKHGSVIDRDWLIDWLVEPQRQVVHARMPQFGLSRDEAQIIARHLLAQADDKAANQLPDGANGPEIIRRGEVLFRSIGCLACHTRGDNGNASLQGGGDLTAVGRKRTAGWLYRWLKEPDKLNLDHRMPVFKLTDDERRSLALFLGPPRSTQEMGSRTSSGGPAVPSGRPGRVPARTDTVRNPLPWVDSLAGSDPHRPRVGGTDDWLLYGGLKTAPLPTGPVPVEAVTASYEPIDPRNFQSSSHRHGDGGDVFAPRDWLASNRAPPNTGSVESDRRFGRSTFVGDQLALVQVSQAGDPAESTAAQKLLETSRCAACHRIDGLKPVIAGINPLEQPVKDWSKACTEAGADPKHVRPSYSLTDDERSAIRAFVDSRTGPRSAESSFATGERLLRQKGCVNCHERDAGRGIATIAGAMARLDQDLAGQSEALVPPNLTAVGDKLRDEALGLAIAGKQKTNRLLHAQHALVRAQAGRSCRAAELPCRP